MDFICKAVSFFSMAKSPESCPYYSLYLIPGSPVSLKRMCLGGNSLLLIYSDARVRLWDAQTKELRRSMTQDKAEELLAQGEWADL